MDVGELKIEVQRDVFVHLVVAAALLLRIAEENSYCGRERGIRSAGRRGAGNDGVAP